MKRTIQYCLTVALSLLSSIAWGDTTSNLSLHVDFEDRTSDQSGNSHTTSLQGSSNSYITGKVGTKAMLFGTSGYLSISDAGSAVDNVQTSPGPDGLSGLIPPPRLTTSCSSPRSISFGWTTVEMVSGQGMSLIAVDTPTRQHPQGMQRRQPSGCMSP